MSRTSDELFITSYFVDYASLWLSIDGESDPFCVEGARTDVIFSRTLQSLLELDVLTEEVFWVRIFFNLKLLRSIPVRHDCFLHFVSLDSESVQVAAI